MPLEQLQGNLFDWKGFEVFGLVSTDTVTSTAFTAKTTTGNSAQLFASSGGLSTDPYKVGNGFGLRIVYNGTNAAGNCRRTGIIVPKNWRKLFLRTYFNVQSNALSSGKKHEIMTLLNSSGNDVLGVCFERTASGLHFRHFFGAPSNSGHPSSAYLGDTNTTNNATGTFFELLVVAEAVYGATNKTNLTLYVNGTARGATIDDSGMAGGPFDPHVTVPGGAMGIMFGSKSMSTVENAHDTRCDVSRFGVYPPVASGASANALGMGV